MALRVTIKLKWQKPQRSLIPDEAIRLYKSVVQRLIDGRGRENYQQATRLPDARQKAVSEARAGTGVACVYYQPA